MSLLNKVNFTAEAQRAQRFLWELLILCVLCASAVCFFSRVIDYNKLNSNEAIFRALKQQFQF